MLQCDGADCFRVILKYFFLADSNTAAFELCVTVCQWGEMLLRFVIV